MATYVPPKRATELIFYIGLVSQADTKLFQTNPTIAAGDFKVSIDGGALNNPTTLPAVTPAGSKAVKIVLSIAEMTGDNIQLICSDASGAEWCDVIINIQTAARQTDDLSFPATSGRSTLVAADGSVSPNWADVKSPTTTVALSGTTVGTATALGAQAKLDVNAEVVDCLNVDTYAEPSGAPAATTTIAGKLGRLYQVMRNKMTVSAGAKSFTNDAGAALWSKTTSDDGTTYTENEGS